MIDATIIIVKLFLASATALIQCYAYIAVCVCVGWGGGGVGWKEHTWPTQICTTYSCLHLALTVKHISGDTALMIGCCWLAIARYMCNTQVHNISTTY